MHKFQTHGRLKKAWEAEGRGLSAGFQDSLKWSHMFDRVTQHMQTVSDIAKEEKDKKGLHW